MQVWLNIISRNIHKYKNKFVACLSIPFEAWGNFNESDLKKMFLKFLIFSFIEW